LTSQNIDMTTTVAKRFEKHVASVNNLINFDRDVLDHAITNLRTLSEKLRKHHQIDNPHLSVDSTLKSIEDIRKNDSLRSRYKTIVNQGLVLLVSYFASSVHDLFRRGIQTVLDKEESSDLFKAQVKISLRELKDVNFEVKDIVPELLIQSKDISFQDMQSIGRTFKEHLGIEIDKDEDVNNIILGQACRHVIVHSAGVINDRLIRQIASANPRTVKNKLTIGQEIEFSPEEINVVAQSMTKYIRSISSKVARHIGEVI